MIKTPLAYVPKSYQTAGMMWTLISLVEVICVLFLFPIYKDQKWLIATQMGIMGLTVLFHMIAMCSDPGNMKKPEPITFM